MQMETEEIGGGVTKASLNGRLDIAGANAIDLRFSVLTGQKRAIVVDLAEVSFIASMGLRLLVVGAKTVASKGGRIALAAPQDGVARVLDESGIGALLGVHATLEEAVAAVAG
jgi:anti-anti-sigma factor